VLKNLKNEEKSHFHATFSNFVHLYSNQRKIIYICVSVYSEDNVSWNFKHIVNDKTIEGVKIISKTKGFDGIKIYCPSILIGDNDEN